MRKRIKFIGGAIITLGSFGTLAVIFEWYTAIADVAAILAAHPKLNALAHSYVLPVGVLAAGFFTLNYQRKLASPDIEVEVLNGIILSKSELIDAQAADGHPFVTIAPLLHDEHYEMDLLVEVHVVNAADTAPTIREFSATRIL